MGIGDLAVEKVERYHCVKSVPVRSYSGLYFPAFGLNTDQNNSEYRHFLRGVSQQSLLLDIFRIFPSCQYFS